MNLSKLLSNKALFTLSSAVLVGGHLLYDYLMKGVIPYHNILAREDMPAISNWWGLITIPLLTWITLTFLHKRVTDHPEQASQAGKGLIGALFYGIVMSVL